MAKRGPSDQVMTSATEPSPGSYDIVGLQRADRMPIKFAGREFDLANLSAEDRAYLLNYPEQVPYFRKNLNVSVASV